MADPIIPYQRRSSRRLLLTELMIETMVDLFEKGHSVENVCPSLGVSSRMFYMWLRWGEALVGVYPDGKPETGYDPHYMAEVEPGMTENVDYYPLLRELYVRVMPARANGRMKIQEDLHKLAIDTKQWQGLAWLLERMYPEQYARGDHRKAAAATVQITNNTNVMQVNLNEEQRAAKILQILRETGALEAGLDSADDAEDDEIYPALTDGEADSIPPSELS